MRRENPQDGHDAAPHKQDLQEPCPQGEHVLWYAKTHHVSTGFSSEWPISSRTLVNIRPEAAGTRPPCRWYYLEVRLSGSAGEPRHFGQSRRGEDWDGRSPAVETASSVIGEVILFISDYLYKSKSMQIKSLCELKKIRFQMQIKSLWIQN